MGATITVTECDDGGTVDGRVGDTIEVHLPENAAGGYRWDIDRDDDCDDHGTGLLEFAGTNRNYPRDSVGSAGEAVFTVRVRAAGNSRLRLKYCRPWEDEAGILKRFTVAVHAAG